MRNSRLITVNFDRAAVASRTRGCGRGRARRRRGCECRGLVLVSVRSGGAFFGELGAEFFIGEHVHDIRDDLGGVRRRVCTDGGLFLGRFITGLLTLVFPHNQAQIARDLLEFHTVADVAERCSVRIFLGESDGRRTTRARKRVPRSLRRSQGLGARAYNADRNADNEQTPDYWAVGEAAGR